MTYTVTCPDPSCEHTFTVDRDPKELEAGDGELVTCPACNEEWEWDYDIEADALELSGDENEDEEEVSDLEEEEEEEEDDE